MPSAILDSDTRHIQHYELIRELGRGGMGVVHLARDLRLGRLVAIKMLTTPGQRQERFLAEARATARCRHEDIVVIHEVGIHGEQPYLVFEYLRGQTLRQWMDARLGSAFDTHDSSGAFGALPAPLTPTRAVELMVPVVRALVCAHDLGIIHRDLKPANILLTDEGVTKVRDFGVAKIGAAREDMTTEAAGASAEPLALTGMGARLGTLPYMSPEQFAGDPVDHRGDIWAVGIMLYELVTGAHPLAPLSLFKLEMLDDLATPMSSVRKQRSDLARARLHRLVLFVDQFEELYTLGADAEERACVLACLSAVADDAASPLRVVLSIRSDFLDRVAEHRVFLDAVTQGLTFLSPLDRDGLREALVRPLETCDHRFESQDMVEQVLDELAATRSPLPLLQFTADKLWARRDRQQRRLTAASLRALGGVTGALASHADSIVASMPAQDARLARAVFLRLVTPERTRALATLAELHQLGRDAESMSRVLARLIGARLLSVEGGAASAADSDGSDGVAEIVHESLIDTWPRLGQWLVESEEDAMFLSRLR
ncbi:MAG TPA: serine/threonine-protein kinase, partial [Haliangium sp.]|nr:serine/threonine-protein kinase [Haliangium sp.]